MKISNFFLSLSRRHNLFALALGQISVGRSVRQCAVRVGGARCGQSLPNQHLQRRQVGTAQRVARLLPRRQSREADLHCKGAELDRVLVGAFGRSSSSQLALSRSQAICTFVRVAGRDSGRCQHPVGRGHSFYARVQGR
jgi:hypothetical protein